MTNTTPEQIDVESLRAAVQSTLVTLGRMAQAWKAMLPRLVAVLQKASVMRCLRCDHVAPEWLAGSNDEIVEVYWAIHNSVSHKAVI